MNIINKSGGSYSAPLNEGSLVHRELMGDHYILLVFNTAEPQYFRLGDYCETDYGRFELVDLYEPEYDPEKGGYKYNLRLDAYYMKWKNKIIKFIPSNQQSEMSFTLTRDLEGQMELFMSNLAYLGTKDSSYLFNGSTAFTYDIDYAHVSHKMMPVTYDSISLIEALNRYAEQWECEWWVTDNCIHFGRCELGNSATNFEINDNVAEMSRTQGSKQYITRLYVFGSERNIPANYRKSESEMIVNGVVQRRLMLPEGTPYLQVAGITEEQAVEGVLILDDVYPRTQCRVGGVSTYTSNGTDEEGNETTETFYRVSDSSGFINAIDETFRLPNESFHIQFTSGLLNGMEFECNLIENDQLIGKCFEIIANEDYGVKLPKVGFCPADEDTYIITGWDSTKIADTNIITNAETELVAEGNKYLAKSMVDPSEYTCTMISKKMQDLGMPVKYGQEGNEAYVPLPYDLGDRVNLQNPAIVGSSRSSRIIGYEIKLDIPADSPQFIVGESLRYSKSGALEKKLNELAYGGSLYTGNGEGGSATVYVIGTGDATPATNKNVYSAIRSDNQYARKDRNDVVKSLWTFKNGNGMKRGLQTDDYLLNTNEGNLFGKGFELVSQTNAIGDTRTRLEVDELFVRIKAFFASLEIREMTYVGGNYVFSSAGSKIYYVEWLDAQGNVLQRTSNSISSIYTFRCYLYSDDGSTATINQWAVDDQVMCRTFNIDAGVHQNVSNKYYWRRATGIGIGIIKSRALEAIEKQYLAEVEAVNNWQVMTAEEQEEQTQALADLATARTAAIAAVNAGNVPEGAADAEAFTSYQYVDISMSDCDAGSDYPEDDDTIVQFGNWTNAARQGIIYLQVEGAGSPAIMEYAKVGADGHHFVIPDPNLLLSPTKNVIYGEFHSVVDSESGNTGSGDTIDDQLRALIDRLNDIQNQADKKFEMWFGTYVPLPNIVFSEVKNTEGSNPASMGWYEVTGDRMYDVTEDTEPVNGKNYYIKTDNNGSANVPASEWDTEALKALHAQDLFYDTMREPASDGGRAWRWEAISVDGTVIYRWIETMDKDSIASLEKISDVASDGKLTGGAEKTRVYIDWMKAVQDYSKYRAQAIDYGLNDNVYWGDNENIFVAYDTAFKKLARLLNGDDTTSESLYVANDILNGTVAPAWLANLSTTTVIPSPAIYREIWNNYYAALAALLKAIQKRAKELADQAQTSANEALNRIDGIAADGVLSTTEIPDLKREFETAYRQREEMTDLATDDTTHKLIDASLFAPLNTYLAAFKSLANYLNRQGGANGSGTYGAWTEPTGGTYSVSNSGTAANATYEIVAKSQLADADFPNLLGIDADVKFQANWASPTTDGDGGKKFRDLWADLERQRVALANAMATLTKETADGAQEAVDDLADDKILSAGSEKSKLLLEWLDVISAYEQYTPQAVDHLDWLGTTGNEGTVRTALSTAKDTFIAKVKALGSFLNGGESWDYAYNAASKPLPQYIGTYFGVDTNLTANSQTAAGYRQCWSQYYDAHITLLKWIASAGKIKTEKAQADATEALNAIDGIAADGILSTTELPDLKREFETAYRQREEMTDLATDDTTYKLIDSVLRVPLDDYLSKFAALSNYLNQGSAWSEPTGGTYTVNNGSGVTDANATYNIVAKSPLADSDFPTLLGITEDVEFVANWDANPQVADNGAAFRNLWAALATAQVTLANAMATLAKKAGDDAQEDADKALWQLSDLADDNILTEQEKLSVLREWAAARKEFAQLTQQAAATHVGYTDYSNAYYKLANYLVDLTTDGTGNRQGSTVHNKTIDRHTYNFSVDYEYPQMLCYINGSTNISGSTFMAYWSNYYKERSNLLAALSASHVSYFVGSSVPSAPYYIGDLWLKLTSGSSQSASNVEENGEMMVCINDCTTAGDETEQDWANLKEITEKRDPRLLLAMLGEKAYNFMGDSVRSRGYIRVYFASSSPSSGSAGDIWYNGSALCQYVSGEGWESALNESLQTACSALYNILGNYTIKIFSSTSNSTAKTLYDLCVTRIQFTDTNLPADNAYRTVDGGLEIWMYGENGWEILQESTRSLIENLKGYVRMVAFGSENGTITSAGIVTSSNFVNMFATAQNENGQTIAQAYLSAFVTKMTKNGQDYLQSGIKISADQIELTGTDSISMLVNGIGANQKQYGVNLLPNSIINETSNEYGFAIRSLKLESGKTYTLSAKGIVHNSLPSNMVLMVCIYRYKDSSETNVASEIGVNWASGSASLAITKNDGAARIASVTFTANKTATYYIASYLYDENQTNGMGNGGTRTYPVTVEWYKVEEGSVATPWVASDADGKRYENYVVNPLAVGGTKGDESCASYSEVTDAVFGKVMQISHNIDGHWQLTFSRRSTYANLTDNYATFFVICKEINNQSEAYTSDNNGSMVRRKLRFGDSNDVAIVDTTTAAFIDLGNGWRKYYATKKMTSALASTFGICHVLGTWQIYSVGIVLGGTCPLVDEIMANNSLLSTGINIVTGKIELRADKVIFTSSDGTISNKIWIDPTTGTLHATNATITGTVTATAGKIGGFAISGNGLTNENDNGTFTNDAYIILRNDDHRSFVGIGPNVLPSYSTARATARFEIEDTANWFGYGKNIAVVMRAKNADYNYAFVGEGNGLLNGAVDGFKLNVFTPSSGANQIPIAKGNRVYLKNSSMKAVYLPTLAACRTYLDINSSTYFALELIIMGASGASGMVVYGYRNGEYNDGDCPHIRNNDSFQDVTGGIGIAEGDILHLILVYDGSAFNAYMISHRD